MLLDMSNLTCNNVYHLYINISVLHVAYLTTSIVFRKAYRLLLASSKEICETILTSSVTTASSSSSLSE